MIRQIYDISALSLRGDYYGAKAAAYFRAYGGKYDFCRFYISENTEKYVTGGMLMFNAGLTVFGSPDIAELAEFTAMCSPQGIECPPHISDRLYLNGYSRVKRTMFGISADRNFNGAEFAKGLMIPPSLMRMSEIMSECFGGFSPELWYTDNSHRVRHGVSRAYLYRDSAAASVDFTAHGCGYISSVGVIPTARGNGYGRNLLQFIANELEKENIGAYLWADEDSEGYYRKIGLIAEKYDIFYVKINREENQHG